MPGSRRGVVWPAPFDGATLGQSLSPSRERAVATWLMPGLATAPAQHVGDHRVTQARSRAHAPGTLHNRPCPSIC
jgi:hypothetical protein